MPSDASDDASPCPFMARLIDLLGEIQAQRDRRRAVTVADRLDRLDQEARHRGAPRTTLAAIKGARLLLDLSQIPQQGGTKNRAAL